MTGEKYSDAKAFDISPDDWFEAFVFYRNLDKGFLVGRLNDGSEVFINDPRFDRFPGHHKVLFDPRIQNSGSDVQYVFVENDEENILGRLNR
jgi:hypothetical protein